MLQVDIVLPSGKPKNFSIAESSKVGDLKCLAQKSFQQGFLKFITADGHALVDPNQSLLAAGLQEGDHLTAIVQQAKMAATDEAFAMWCCGGDRIVTWGRPDRGGDSSAVQDQLRNVQQVQATYVHLLRSWQMDLSLLGGAQDMTALRSKISLGMCSRFRPQITHLLPSWQMDLSLLGVTH